MFAVLEQEAAKLIGPSGGTSPEAIVVVQQQPMDAPQDMQTMSVGDAATEEEEEKKKKNDKFLGDLYESVGGV
jgi:hypothetical protein